MPKRNVAFIKPEEPSFLKKIKEQIGYREGPSIQDKVGIIRKAIRNRKFLKRNPFFSGKQ